MLSRRQIRAFYYFITADGGVRFEHATDDQLAPPLISFPIVFPSMAELINGNAINIEGGMDSVPVRRYALMREEYLQDGTTKIFTYQEIR